MSWTFWIAFAAFVVVFDGSVYMHRRRSERRELQRLGRNIGLELGDELALHEMRQRLHEFIGSERRPRGRR